jgi:acyl-coenzyme A thioesterase PaaI-like protein
MEQDESAIQHFSALPWTRDILQDAHCKVLPEQRTTWNKGRGHTLMGKTWNTPTTIQHRLSLWREPSEYIRFYTFGPDLNAHPDLLHGGVVTCILDSCMGGAVGMTLAGQEGGPPNFTVQLNVTFKAPVRTPGTVVVRSWVEKAEGRKAWAVGTIEGEGGVVHATAQGLWVKATARL